MKQSIAIRASNVASPANCSMKAEKRFRNRSASALIDRHVSFTARSITTLRGACRPLGFKETCGPRDLVLVGSGDPNLSGRIQPGDQLAFQNVDHSYDASPDTRAVPGDPLGVIRELASQVAAGGSRNDRRKLGAALSPWSCTA